jgi:hypothetical protein
LVYLNPSLQDLIEPHIGLAKRYGESKTDSKPSKFLKEIDYQQNESIDFLQADAQDLSCESASEENQTQTRLMK